MKRYTISELQPGMIVGSPIFNAQKQLILESDITLTKQLISRLNFYHVYDVYIKDNPDEKSVLHPETELKPEPMPVIQSRAQKIQSQPEFQQFKEEYDKEVSSFHSSMARIITDTQGELNVDELLQETANLIPSDNSSLDLFDMLHNMRQIDDSIYAHSMNVALIARTLGKWLNFSEEDLQVLTLCGLLHDVGKTAIPKELLDKPGQYTEEEYRLIQQHPLLSYKILKNYPLDMRVKNAALMHHERCDGSGYPQKLKRLQIHDFAQIIAIADVYDAMTSARSYREPLCPFQVIDAFEKEGLQKYHPKFILTFLENIAYTYKHNRVLLNTGQTATIAYINNQHLTKPLIRFDDGTTIDMYEHKDLEIVAIV